MRETAPDTAVRSAEPAEPGGGGVNARNARGYAYPHAREDSAPLWTRWARGWVPPQPWRHRPASLAGMARYARIGKWTGAVGPARRAGVWWLRLVAIPVTVACHYAAWTVARPSRTVALAVLWTVLMHIPAVRMVAGWLLPVDPWPTWLP